MGKTFFAACLIVLLSSATLADITVTTDATIKMMYVSLGDIRSVQMIKGMKSRTETELPAMMKAMQTSDGRSQEYYDILSLDDKVKWSVYPKDKTYAEKSMDMDDDPITPLVGDQQSLDSALSTGKSKLIWTVDSLKQSKDTCLSIPCSIIRSSATGKVPDSSESMSVSCEIWIPQDVSILTDMIAFNGKMAEIADIGDNFMMELYSGLISNFGVTFTDLGLDTVQGTPMKIDFALYASLTESDIASKLDPAGTADALASQKALEDAMENMDAESGADTLAVDEAARDDMTDIFAQLLTGMKDNLKPGRMELFGFSMEITDIDTTALPNSLFEIPSGYTEQ